MNGDKLIAMAWRCLFVCFCFCFFFFFFVEKDVCLCLVERMRGSLVCWLEGATGVVVSDVVPSGLRKRHNLVASLHNLVELWLWLRLVCILMKLVTSIGNF